MATSITVGLRKALPILSLNLRDCLRLAVPDSMYYMLLHWLITRTCNTFIINGNFPNPRLDHPCFVADSLRKAWKVRKGIYCYFQRVIVLPIKLLF